MNYINFICPVCKKQSKKYVGHYNRSKSIGAPVYCDSICAGMGRRNGKTVDQKKKEKSEYDKKLRQDPVYNAKRKIVSHNWFVKDYTRNPEKYRKERQRKYQKHLKYLSTPKYKAWKKNYDERHLAGKHYGEFAEAAIILKRLEGELESKAIKSANGITFNKSSQQRKRKWQQLNKVLQQNH